MNKTKIIVLIGLLGSIALMTTTYWSKVENQKSAKLEIEELAADANFLIGDVAIIAPLVVVLNQRSMAVSFTLNNEKAATDWKSSRASLRVASSTASNPLELEKVDLRVRALGWIEVSGEYGTLLCERLTRKWARSICFDLSAPLLQSLPYNQTITFADNRKLENWTNSYHFGGYNGTLWDRLKNIDWQPEVTLVICANEVEGSGRSCSAAILIDEYLVAIWSVWDSKLENVEQMAKRQGAAILAWAKYGLGTIENFKELQALASKLRSPSGESKKFD